MKTSSFAAKNRLRTIAGMEGVILFDTDGKQSRRKDPFKLWDANDRLFGLRQREARFIQFREFGKLVANLTWHPEKDPKSGDIVAAKIDDVVVAQSHRQAGLGRAIMECAHEQILENGIHTARLYPVGESSDFYAHLGYEYEQGEVRATKSRSDEDFRNMTISL